MGPTAYLTWDDVRFMISRGACIAAHGCNHPRLSALSREEVESEAMESKRILESETGLEVEAFVYPFGDRSSVPAGAAGILANSGFKLGFTTERKWLDGRRDLFAVPRLGVGDWPVWRLSFELALTDGIEGMQAMADQPSDSISPSTDKLPC